MWNRAHHGRQSHSSAKRRSWRFCFHIRNTPSAFTIFWRQPSFGQSRALRWSPLRASAEKVSSLFDHYARTRAEGFGAEVKRRIILGTYFLSSGYYDAYSWCTKSARAHPPGFRTRVWESRSRRFATSPSPAFKLGEKTTDPLQMYLADIFTNAANLAGICGISVPCGFAESENGKKLPIGLQLLGKALDEARIFQIAHAYEQSTDWHKVRPKVSNIEL